MATPAPQQPTKPVQVIGKKSEIDYDDFLVIGSSGRGKTTTADKLLVANPTKFDYGKSIPLGGDQVVVDAVNKQLKYTDITMWLGTLNKEYETHLKFLDNCRKSPNPHTQINKVRSAAIDESMAVFEETTQVEVLSNETSKVRVMDVPGFFDGASIIPKNTDLQSPTESLNINNLGIMRSIIRIQTTLAMKFKRILYFLPSRGPLERADAVLRLELNWMAHFFGKAIFKIMVLVATVPSTMSEMPMDDEKKFSDRDVQLTKKNFRKALQETFRSFSDHTPSDDPLPDPPLIFISQTNTCEEILAKVKEAAVVEDGLNLQIDKNTCSQCGVKIGIVKGQRVTCYFGEDLTDGIPYEESTCHPHFIPKYTRIDKIWGSFKYFASLQWIVGKSWPVFAGEKCIECGELPNTQGCMQVAKEYRKNAIGIVKIIDHTNQVPDDQPPDETPDTEEEVSSSPVESSHQSNAQNGSIVQENPSVGGEIATHAVPSTSESDASLVIGGIGQMYIREQNPSNAPTGMQNRAWKSPSDI